MKRLSRTSFRLSSKDPDKDKGFDSIQGPASPPAMKDLQDFLTEAELSEYYSPLLTRLKVSTVEHLKYVREEDLEDIGMTRPEMRRLKKFYKKEFPQGAINKLRKVILKGTGDGGASRTLSPSPPTQRGSRTPSVGAPYARPPGKQLIPLDSLQLSRTLGEGEFGVVQQGIWTVETGEKLQVAVKRLSRERMNTGTQSFLKEAVIMQELDHEHIVRMYGVVLDTDDNVMLVTELAPMRSLLECLKDTTLRVDLAIPRLCDYAQQVCDGMSYLENKRLVHRDLAARNILVFNKNQVKISDLGLSRLLGAGEDYYQSKFSVSLKLPIAWCAPECINFLKFTSASDVWSFAVMLWEFFTYGFQPWAGLNGQQILEAIDSGQHLEQPDLCTNEIFRLMLECWNLDPEARPPFGDILLRLPQLRPTQVKALKDCPSPSQEKGYITYRAGDVIVVIDKSPPTTSPPGLVWRGVLANGKSGLFDPTNAVPFIEPKFSPVTAKTASLVRKESGRKSSRKIRADMISHPQNDLRHTGHIGYDGAVFGDVSFIGDNYDKLPVKVGTGSGSSRGSSVMSLPHAHDSPDYNGHVRTSNSQDSLDKDKNGYGLSWMSQESLNSQATFQTDHDMEDDSLFSDFKMPELGSSFDFGPSFMDEVLKALDEKEKQITSTSDPTSHAVSHNHSAEVPVRAPAVRPEPPVPAPREMRRESSSSSSTSSAVPPLPSQPPRVEPPREKKQATVKPMSVYEEKVLTQTVAESKEFNSYLAGDSSRSPSQEKPALEKEKEIVPKVKSSVKQTSIHTFEVFNQEAEPKLEITEEVTPEVRRISINSQVKDTFQSNLPAQVKDSFHGNSPAQVKDTFQSSLPAASITTSAYLQDSADYRLRDVSDSRRSDSRTSSKSSQELETNSWAEPDLIRDSRSSSASGKISAPGTALSPQIQSDAPVFQSSSSSAAQPIISAPQPLSKPLIVPHSKFISNPAPVPAPRPVKPDTSKRSEIPVPKPRPEIQRVEPTIRQTVPASPDIPPKNDKRIDSHIPVPASREREREELKKTIEIVRVEDSGSLREDTSTSFDHSSARSSQRSSLDRSDNTSENNEYGHIEWEHSECSSDSSRPGREADRLSSSIDRKDSFNKKQTSLFEEDLSAPSPQEIMSKLRERRLNRHLDHQRALSGDGDSSSVPTASSRPRPSAREPQGIPGRSSGIDSDEGGGGDGGSEEVDTNPLRMLRGGAIPIRTAGRGAVGRRIAKR